MFFCRGVYFVLSDYCFGRLGAECNQYILRECYSRFGDIGFQDPKWHIFSNFLYSMYRKHSACRPARLYYSNGHESIARINCLTGDSVSAGTFNCFATQIVRWSSASIVNVLCNSMVNSLDRPLPLLSLLLVQNRSARFLIHGKDSFGASNQCMWSGVRCRLLSSGLCQTICLLVGFPFLRSTEWFLVR